MSTEADIEHAIYENAATDGQFAIAYALLRCALWLKYLGGGDNADRMGAVEFLATKVGAVADAISMASAESRVGEIAEALAGIDVPLGRLADAVEGVADAIEELKPEPT